MNKLFFIGNRTDKTQQLNKGKGDFNAFDFWLKQGSKKVSIVETDKRGELFGNETTL
mgnify:CR=1 FL=1